MFAMTSAYSRQNSISLCPASLHTPRPKCLLPQVFLGEGNGTLLQYSCLENWWAIQSMGSQRVGHDWVTWIIEWSSCFPYFLQFKSEFRNKEFMIWATVSSWSWFCWLYRASPSLAARNIINLTLVLTIWWCPCVESSLVLLEESVCYDHHIFLAKLN